MPQRPEGLAISHWHTLFEDFSTSPQGFYAAVEAAVARRSLPDIRISRAFFSEGGAGSAKREYLRISRHSSGRAKGSGEKPHLTEEDWSLRG